MSNRYAKYDDYGLRHLPHHLISSQQWEYLTECLSDHSFIDLKCDRLSREDVLADLKQSIENITQLVPEQSAIGLVIRLIAAFGYVMFSRKVNLEKQVQNLVNRGEIEKATEVVDNSGSSAQAFEVLVKVSHYFLDTGKTETARRILQEILIPRVPDHTLPSPRLCFSLIDRFVERGIWDALAILKVRRPDWAAGYTLSYLVGTFHLSDVLVSQLTARLIEWESYYWRGICLLFLYCRAARAGIPAHQALDELRSTTDEAPNDSEGLFLREIVTRYSPWIENGLTTGQVAFFENTTQREQLPFRFISQSDSDVPEDVCDKDQQVQSGLRAAFGNLWSACKSSGTSKFDNDWLQQQFQRTLQSEGPGTPLALYWYSLLPRLEGVEAGQQPPRSPWQISSIDSGTRLQILKSFLRLGWFDTLLQTLTLWREEVWGTPDLSYVCSAVSELESWPAAPTFLIDISNHLRESTEGPALEVISSLIQGLSTLKLGPEVFYWLKRLLNVIQPKMTISKLDETAVVSLRYMDPTLICEAIHHPFDLQADQLRNLAQKLAAKFTKNESAIAGSYNKTYGSMEYIVDHILAAWTNKIAWMDPNPTSSFEKLKTVLRLGTVNDDGCKLHSWFFWFLLASANPSGMQFQDWLQETQKCTCYREPFERAMFETLGVSTPDPNANIEILLSTIPLIDPSVMQQELGLVEKLRLQIEERALFYASNPAKKARLLCCAALLALQIGNMNEAKRHMTDAATFSPDISESLVGRRIRSEPSTDDRDFPDPSLFFPNEMHHYVKMKSTINSIKGLFIMARSLRSAPELWDVLLSGICRTAMAARDGFAISQALVYAMEHYDYE